MGEALEISRETGIGFLGPWALGTLALVESDVEASRSALAEGEKLLAGDCVGHNYFAFYPNAMEVALRSGDWDALERYAAALESYSKAEPLPWTDFFAAWGRTQAALGRGARDGAIVQEVVSLLDDAKRAGLRNYISSLQVHLTA